MLLCGRRRLGGGLVAVLGFPIRAADSAAPTEPPIGMAYDLGMDDRPNHRARSRLSLTAPRDEIMRAEVEDALAATQEQRIAAMIELLAWRVRFVGDERIGP